VNKEETLGHEQEGNKGRKRVNTKRENEGYKKREMMDTMREMRGYKRENDR